jgi:hypothetical protein
VKLGASCVVVGHGSQRIAHGRGCTGSGRRR